MNARAGVVLKALTLVVVLLFSGVISTHQVQANPGNHVEISIFQDALAPYGNWVNHRTYGQVWYPRNVARDWRPYTDGYWAHTDDYGWLWVSYEPWGWAPFHYGRWAWDNWYGWVWVPGRTWAPAWVFWRSGGGYAAWTPMPPNVVWQPGVGLNTSYFNYDRDIRWDSWVAVHEYDLPNRHISQHINPPSQNQQIINVTNNNNNITLINNTIVNQGVPVKQIEEVTRRPLETVVPKVHDRLDINTAELHEGQPDIIRLPMAAPTPDEIQHNEELARRLDGKNPDGTRTELPLANSGQAGEHEPRVPGRLVGAPAPVQGPYAVPERPTQGLVEPVGQALPEPVIPKAPLLSLDPDTQHKALNVGSHQETLVPAQQTTPQSSVTLQPIAPVPAQIDGASAPISLTGQPPVLTDTPVKASLQNDLKPSEWVKQSDNLPLQVPVVDQAPVLPKTEGASVSIPVTGQQPVLTEVPAKPFLQGEPQQPSGAVKQFENSPSQAPAVDQQQMESLQRQQKIDQLQQELARSQNKQQQQETGTQPQQLERPVDPVQQIQQPEAVRQQPIQNQQQIDTQPQQVERPVESVQQMQQPEAVRQQQIQNQQQTDMQSQQAERAQQEAQQIQQPEVVRQQQIQNQQQIDTQPQQVERPVEPVQQIQQQEVVRQPQIQNQQQTDMQSQQAERAQQEAQQIQQQEAARQQQIQTQQQTDMQSQQAEHAQQEAQQMQQQEAARQQQIQIQQQVDRQSQQAERAQQEAQQMQQQEAARQQQQQQPASQPSVQNQQPPEIQRKQTERPKEELQQIQPQQVVTPQ